MGGNPVFIASGKGSRIADIDGRQYVDYVCSWGPLIHGHAYPPVAKAIQQAAALGTSFGAPTLAETALAKRLVEAFPSIEQVRLVNSGTEAAMSAVRLARAFTKRDLLIKFEGCYHGHADGLLVKAGAAPNNLGAPSSPGIPLDFGRQTLSLPYNHPDAVAAAMEARGSSVACMIVEPVAGNMGVVPPNPGFLEALRELCTKHGALLIFDEVTTGFRVAYGGAQERYGIPADVTILGKVIGGGLPLAAYGAREEIMSQLAPLGSTYQAGSLCGNPVAVAAGLATLKGLSRPGFYRDLATLTERIIAGFQEAAKRARATAQFASVGSMFCYFFSRRPVADYRGALACDTKRYAQFFRAMLRAGYYFPPSQFESAFLSAAHSEEDVQRTIQAAEEAFKTTT